MNNIKEIVKNISLEDLQQFVIEYAETNSSFARKLATTFMTAKDSSQMDYLKDEFSKIIKEHSRHNFIEWRNADGFERDMMRFLGSLVYNDSIIQNEAFKDVLTFFSKKFGNLQIDDSNGCMSILCSLLEDLWNLFLIRASLAIQTDVRKWIETHVYHEKMWMMEEHLEKIYLEQFQDKKNLAAKIKFYDKQIQNEQSSSEENFSRKYHIENWVCQRAETMKQQGCKPNEIEDYLKSFATMENVVFKLFDLYMESKRYNDAEIILLQFHKSGKCNLRFKTETELKLKNLYQETKQQAKYLAILKNLTREQRSLELFKEFKATIPAQKWKTELADFVKTILSRDFKMTIYMSENMTDDLYSTFKEQGSKGLYFYHFQRFGQALCPKYEGFVVEELSKYLNSEMQNATNRKEYSRVVTEAKTLLNFKGGLEEVAKLKKSWIDKYQRRPAMIDELKRIKA